MGGLTTAMYFFAVAPNRRYEIGASKGSLDLTLAAVR